MADVTCAQGGSDCIPTKAYYDEKLLVGYRWYDQHKVAPAFEFGFGLSYTSFEYQALRCTATTCTFTVENSGKVAGAEVAQLYLSFPARSDSLPLILALYDGTTLTVLCYHSAGEPPKQLKAFQKVQLAPGAKKTLTLALTPRSFSIWSVDAHTWTVVGGEFGVSVGGSSRDVRLSTTVHVTPRSWE